MSRARLRFLPPRLARLLLEVCRKHDARRAPSARPVRRRRRRQPVATAPVLPAPVSIAPPPHDVVADILALVGPYAPALAANPRYRAFLAEQPAIRQANILFTTRLALARRERLTTAAPLAA